ncbi:MAG TPA: M2 family metallopeptidase [Myxococcota bacterium]|nr:M2 family metallopeptidase [Myxococcota bacterium]HQK50541.1 M2 family metallopeptidase [Myxococcota bacterium]
MKKATGILVLAAMLAACAKEGTVVRGDGRQGSLEAEARTFLEGYNLRRAALEKKAAEAYWQAANSGRKEDFEAFAEADLATRKFHSDREAYRTAERLLAASEGFDPVTRRSLQVVRLAYQENQLPPEMLEELVRRSSEIEQTFNTYRATLDGRAWSNNELLEMLQKTTDSARRQAIWEALKGVGAKVGPMLLELAQVRNRAARMLGHGNFWEMRIRMQEHDPEMLLAIFDRLERDTETPFREMKARLDAEVAARLKVPVEALMPWHYDNPFFQAAPPSARVDPDVFYEDRKKEDIVAIAQRFYADIGLPMDAIIARSDYYEREGKDQHAFCTDIDRAGDVRMLLNIRPSAEWMDTMLHEAGHAVYAAYNDPSLPWVLRDSAHILTTEGVAMLFGALGQNPTWMVDYAGVDRARAEAAAEALYEQRRREQLLFARWDMVMFRFEKALYEDPTQDLNRLWYDLVERLQHLRRPAGRDLPDWAAKPHFTIAPVYYHNYLLGELFAAQVRARLVEIAGHQGPAATLSFRGRKDFGAFFRDAVFRPGMRWEWPEFVRRATGRPFGPEAFVAEVR